ncbi:MAG: septal ring lytic transglycosylase RlpA family protein [Anderseniella sp.]|nr:septal ring lytic transglycosylase RlpA family protein [Anderseniella sp.]
MTDQNLRLPTRRSSGYYFVGAGVLCAVAIALAGCSGSGKKDPFAGVGSPIWDDAKGPMPKGGGRRHVGKSYQVADIWFHPKHEPNYSKTGVASWYGPKFNRRMTSNGEWFDMEQLTAAHTTMQLPSYAKVTNLENGREVIVRVNDRGPFVNDRIIDMSKRSADLLGFRGRGKTKAHVQYIGPAPLEDPTYGHLAAMNQELKRRTPLNEMIASANLRDGRYGENQPSNRTATAAATADTGAEGYYIQVAAFSDPGNAQRTKDALADLGSVQIKPANGSFGPLYRVRVGPLDNHASAQSALQQVRARGHHDAVVNSTIN